VADEAATSDNTTASVLLAEAGWDRVLNGILHGFCHDLNGRVTSLEAIKQLVGMGEPTPDLSIEAERLSGVTKKLASICGDLGGPAGGLMLEDVAEAALSLAAKGLRDLSEPVPLQRAAESMPVRVNETRLLRGLVVLVHTVAEAARASPATAVEADELEVRFVVGWPGAEAPTDTLNADAMSALASLFKMDEGALAITGEKIVLRFPSLAALRAMTK
jgi:hypothetical protein